MRALKYIGIGAILAVGTILFWLAIGKVLLGNDLKITPDGLQIKVWGEVIIVVVFALVTLIIGFIGDWLNKKMIVK